MKKKGFTLIELLAVIVVLAIIALIATPIVMNTIKRSQKGAAERSADNYIEAVETAVATSKLDSDGVPDGTYTINDKGNLEGNGLTKTLEIEMSGNKPKGGTITIKDGRVTTDSKMTIGSYEVAYNPTSKKYEAVKNGGTTPDTPTVPDTPSNQTVVYRWSTDTIKIGDTIDPSDTSKFTKDASTLGENYYLKHVLDKDNKVTESYVCAIFNSGEYCLTDGEYGYAENESDYTGSMLILKNLRDKNIDGLSCGFGVNSYSCSNGSVHLVAGVDVSVSAGNSDGSCNVYGDSGSYCESF